MTSTRTRLGHRRTGVAEDSPEQRRDELIEQAASAAPDMADLIRLYYRYLPPEEINDTDPVDLVGIVRSHRHLAGLRVPGRPAVRVINPDAETDGWRTAGTIVQLVTDDMPYLVESVTAALVRSGLQVHRVVHPIVVVNRDVVGGELRDILTSAEADAPPAEALAESWMSIEVDLITDQDRKKEITNTLKNVLNDVREVVEDTDRMAGTATTLAEQLETHPPVDEERAREGAALLRWLAAGHFTFLGYRHYELVRDGNRRALKAVLASGLGVLRQDSLATRNLTAGPDADVDANSPDLLILTEASAPSSVYRSTFPYYVGVKTFAEDGTVTGEHRFLGVFTINALHEDVLDIPVVGRRVLEVIHRAGFPLESYTGQKMLEVIQNWPRSELFSTNADTLYQTTTGVIALADRRRLRLFLRRDPYRRFFSCLVFTPRDRYTTTSRIAMQNVLIDELGGTHVEFSTRIGETSFAQVHFTVHTDPDAPPADMDVNRIQERLTEAVRTWDDRLVEAVFAEQRDKVETGVPRTGDQLVTVGAESANEQGQRFASVFPEAYKEDFSALEALTDLRRLEGLRTEGDLDMSFYRRDNAKPGERRVKLYLAGEGVTLSQMLPVLQYMGVEVVDERPYELHREDGTRWWIYDFGLRVDPAVVEDTTPEQQQRQRTLFQDAFRAIWRGDAESDRFNALVLRGGLAWRQAALLRAYARYLRQAGVPFDQGDVESAVLDHTGVATALVRLFETRFDLRTPDDMRARELDTQVVELTRMIDEVTSLDADRVLRSLLALIRATLRTNYNVRDEQGQPRSYLAIKLDPAQVLDLPEPRPRFEIFVYSPRVEGVHLRFGPVARGGLRWSDRRSDFRTEILGLVKAQAVKNAVIVPVGAKGGFVVKRPPAPTGDPGKDRETYLAEGIGCYRMFISGLLDLTDNLRGGEVVPARDVVRYDADDTYLVVAADKGTATFSDIANEVAASYSFWLGDAFASGGSVGYDHKAMGITARGAWESVKRHFRELGVDTQTEDFTVVGVGDMAGDVFGNGMLLSEHIRLVAAFNHMHVFLDPNPDAAVSYAERRRLFELPRSSWDDYDRSLISEGGGVWPRTLKSIPISEQARISLGLEEGVTKLSPPELIKAILLAPADLLWNGGIGTYVKASTETHADVGDKANDAVRVNGADLRVMVVGEGGNLGLTQRGRVEFARADGKVNTDALDNSAGVDCSDHEVNIKILLDQLVTGGVLAKEQRNELLAEMTDEVSALVLADNYSQNAVLGVSRAHSKEMLTVLARLVTDLEENSGLDRSLEALPTKAQFRDMDKRGDNLTSPELATLLAHVKLRLKHEMLTSELPDADVFARRLPEYFPTQLRKRFSDAVPQHPLSRQITTTLVVNEVVDGGGVSYAFRLAEEMNASATDAVRAFAAVTKIFDLPALWRQIQALDNIVPTNIADHMTLESRRLLDRASRWLLSNRPQPLAVGAEINRFHDVVAELVPEVPKLLRGAERDSVEKEMHKLVVEAVPEDLARQVASLLDCYPLLDVIEVAELADRDSLDTERSPRETAELYYALSDHLSIDSMLTSISALERGNRWHALARLALRDDLYSSLRAITLDVLRQSDPGTTADEKIENWERSNARRINRSRESLEEIRSAGSPNLATLSVATRQVRSMVR
ncbi:NAD-glutamate dehydrogenase [Actinophytocola sp.]|uniref:NAD-glutamate dehydrogenase n=1 Tax=Actinophytocola sp. TaxID=1872138 RepID=UPI002ED07DFB